MELIKNGFIQIAHLLIDQSFPDISDIKRRSYKNFKLNLIDKAYRSRLGCYNIKSKTIELSGIKEYCRHDIIITFLHELSHHIETINTGNSGHQNGFYNIHIKLLKNAVDLGLLKIEQITNNKTSNAGNKNKLGKLMNGYTRKGNANISAYIDTSFLNELPEVVYKKEIIKVKCLPEDRFILKENNYKWDVQEEVWNKIVMTTEEYNQEIAFLVKNGYLNIKIDKKVYFAKTIFIHISGNTYPHRDILSSLKYKYKNGEWFKSVKIKYTDLEIMKLRKLNGIKVKYSF